MEESKLQALHDSLSKLTAGRQGLGRAAQYSWQKKKKHQNASQDYGLPSNALYANFVPEGALYNPQDAASGQTDFGDGRYIKRNFSDDENSDDEIANKKQKKSPKLSKEERKALKKQKAKEAKLQAKKEAKLQAKRLAKKQQQQQTSMEEESTTVNQSQTASTITTESSSPSIAKESKKSKKDKKRKKEQASSTDSKKRKRTEDTSDKQSFSKKKSKKDKKKSKDWSLAKWCHWGTFHFYFLLFSTCSYITMMQNESAISLEPLILLYWKLVGRVVWQ